ncbi:hypothetical protein AXF42_Ash017112 [Apostasia shenzhenica]|uniref:Uncharacterized protein n=1 Tax=Apostasia shenzhenica TaxID=1088818 RepID=A0A2H9ZV58_9ASPA|nr:hypothetical protein AXF42_Ash017112 [Apostasia shenzhenica]
MNNLTASEIAGFGVGALLLCATISAPKVDAFIAASQRRSLGICKRCGDLRLIACSGCKGSGLVKKRELFDFGIWDDFYQSFGDEGMKPSLMIKCTKCLSKGHMPCPECSKVL